MTDAKSRQRLLLLCTTTGYQTQAFVDAAEKLGLAVVFVTDRCHVLEDPWQDSALPLRFEDPEAGAQRIAEYAGTNPVAAWSRSATGRRPPRRVPAARWVCCPILRKPPTPVATSTAPASACGERGSTCPVSPASPW